MTRSARGFVTTATALGVTFLLAFAAQYGPEGLRAKLDAYLVLWPQGWTFFTGLDQDVVTGYRVADDTGRLDGFDAPWYGSLGRTGDARMQDLRQVARQIPDAYWQSCAGIVEMRCTTTVDNDLVFKVSTQALRSELCGRVAIAVRRPSRPEHADRIAFADVACAK